MDYLIKQDQPQDLPPVSKVSPPKIFQHFGDATPLFIVIADEMCPSLVDMIDGLFVTHPVWVPER